MTLCSQNITSQIKEAFAELNHTPKDTVIVSRENEEIETSRYLLTVLSPTLRSLLSVEPCISNKIFLPDCSAKSIKHFLNVVSEGFTYFDHFNFSDLNDIVDTAKLLEIDIQADKVGLRKEHRKDVDNLSSLTTTKQIVKIERDTEILNKFDPQLNSDEEFDSTMIEEYDTNYDVLNMSNVNSKNKEKSIYKPICISRVIEKLGGEENGKNIKMAWNKARQMPKSDDFLRSLLLQHNFTRREARYFFEIGNSKFDRLKSLDGPCPTFDEVLINMYAIEKEEKSHVSPVKNKKNKLSYSESEESKMFMTTMMSQLKQSNDDENNVFDSESIERNNLDEGMNLLKPSKNEAPPNNILNRRKQNGILKVKEKLGEERANLVKDVWSKVRKTSEEDLFLRSAMVRFNLSRDELRSFFGIGTGKANRIRRFEGLAPHFDDYLSQVNNSDQSGDEVNKSEDETIFENKDKMIKELASQKRLSKAISRSKKKLGGHENALILLVAWGKVRKSKKSDVFLKKLMLQYDLTPFEARCFFKVGSGKMKRLKQSGDPDVALSDIPALVESIVQEEEKIMTVEEDGETFYICNLCEYRSIKKYNIREHKESKHGKICYYCDQCEFTTKRKEYLENHVENIHSGNYFPCDQCGKRFSKNTIRSHIHIIHEGVKFQCELCQFKTLHKTSLKLHVDNFHKGIKYPCGECNYKATQLAGLKRHEKSQHNLAT